MRVTISDVAKQARVSKTTVSLVLNDAPGVSHITREHVLRVMKEMNYTPDALARSLSLRRTQAVALAIPQNADSLVDPYFIHLVRGTLEAVRDHGYKMLLEIADDRFITQRLWEDLFASKRVDGLLVATPFLDQAYLAEMAACKYPVMLINGARPDLPELDFYGYDDVRCGLDATYYLIGLGHRRIGHIAGPEKDASALNRLEGYKQALARARISFRPEDILPGDYKRQTGEEAMQAWLARPAAERPTAIFSANDTMAIAAIQVAQNAGLTIPGDFSIIGVDDTGAAERATPALTTFRQDLYLLARTATRQFLKKLDERTSHALHERLPMTLIERATCAPLERDSAQNRT